MEPDRTPKVSCRREREGVGHLRLAPVLHTLGVDLHLHRLVHAVWDDQIAQQHLLQMQRPCLGTNQISSSGTGECTSCHVA